MTKQNEKPLSLKEERFCQNIVAGMSKSDAWRQANPRSKASGAGVNTMACKLAAQHHIQSRIKELYREMTLEQVLSPAEHLRNMLEDRLDMKGAESYSAVAAIDGQIARSLGMGVRDADNINVTFTNIDARQIVARLGGGRDAIEADLTKLLVTADNFASDNDDNDNQ